MSGYSAAVGGFLFQATLGHRDPDRWLRWALTAIALAAGATISGLVGVVAWLARLTAELILRLLDAWLGLALTPMFFSVTLELEPPLPIEVQLDQELPPLAPPGLEPEDLLAGGPPAWAPAPEQAPMLAPHQTRQTARTAALEGGLLALLGSAETSGMASLFSGGDFGSIAGIDTFADGDRSAVGVLGGLGSRGSGVGSGGGGSARGVGSGQLGGLATIGSRGGATEGLGERMVPIGAPTVGAPSDRPSAGGGEQDPVPSRLTVDRRRRATVVDPGAPAGGATCTVTIDPDASLDARATIAGCPSALHSAARREIARRGWESSGGAVIIRVVPAPSTDE